MQTTLRVVTCNTQGRSDSAADFAHTVACVYDLAPDVGCWQEVNDAPDKAAVTDGMPGYSHAHMGLSVPISTRLPIVEADRHRTHGGKHHASPARWVAWVVVDADGQRVPVCNSHFVSGAWNDKPKPHKAWRRLRWTEHEAEMADIIARLYDDYGVVIFGGDFNRRHVAKLHPGAVWLDDRGIDKIGAIGITSAGPARRVRTPSDHDARVVDVTL